MIEWLGRGRVRTGDRVIGLADVWGGKGGRSGCCIVFPTAVRVVRKGFPFRDLWLQHVPAGDRLPHVGHHGRELGNGCGMDGIGAQVHESQSDAGREIFPV